MGHPGFLDGFGEMKCFSERILENRDPELATHSRVADTIPPWRNLQNKIRGCILQRKEHFSRGFALGSA
jgi:hypothetical protein